MDDKNKYSPEDDESFDRLMNFPEIRSTTSELDESGEECHQVSSIDLDYTDTDNQAFGELMNNSVSAGKSRSSHSTGNSYLVDGYSENDNGMFDAFELTIQESNLSSHQLSSINFVPSDQKQVKGQDEKLVQSLDSESIEYSLADKQAFSRLMFEEFGDGDDLISETVIAKPVSETSHIKIIDFDKEQAKEKSLSRLGRNHIKIRYFD